MSKKGKRKVQGVPQSQTAALPRPQEEEETDKYKQVQTGQTYEKYQAFKPLLQYISNKKHKHRILYYGRLVDMIVEEK